jgi:hypothetical protein
MIAVGGVVGVGVLVRVGVNVGVGVWVGVFVPSGVISSGVGVSVGALPADKLQAASIITSKIEKMICRNILSFPDCVVLTLLYDTLLSRIVPYGPIYREERLHKIARVACTINLYISITLMEQHNNGAYFHQLSAAGQRRLRRAFV